MIVGCYCFNLILNLSNRYVLREDMNVLSWSMIYSGMQYLVMTFSIKDSLIYSDLA